MGLITAYAKLFVLPIFIAIGILYTIALSGNIEKEKKISSKIKSILLESLTNIFAPCSRTNFDKVNHFSRIRQIFTVIIVILYGFTYPAVSFLMLIIFPDTYTGEPPIFSHRIYFSPTEIIIALGLLILGPLAFLTMICMELWLDQIQNFEVQRSFLELPNEMKDKLRNDINYFKIDKKMNKEFGLNVLKWTASNGNLGVLKKSYRSGLRKKHIENEIFEMCAQNGHLDAFKYLLYIFNHIEVKG